MSCLNCYNLWRNGYCNACYIHYKKYNKFKDVTEIYAKILVDFSKGKNYS